jgi:hypothetical protein
MVNGFDPPLYLYYNTTHDNFYYVTVESRDVREREEFRWKAGFVDASVYPFVLTDNTADFKDPAVSTTVWDGTFNHGFYVASEFSFNRVKLVDGVYNVTALQEVRFWNNEYEWVSGGSAGIEDRATYVGGVGHYYSIEHDAAFSDYGSTEGNLRYIPEPVSAESILGQSNPDLIGYYVTAYTFRDAGGGAASVESCTGIEVSHTQYLRMVTGGYMPHDVIVDFVGRIVFACNNLIHLGLVNRLDGWQVNYVEIFEAGGDRITAMKAGPGGTLVFKPNAVYLLSGNSFQNYMRVLLSADTGTFAPDSVQEIDGFIYFLSSRGIERFDGQAAQVISKHVRSDVPLDETATAFAIDSRYYISFPNFGHTLHFDADTYRTDSMGDGRVSFFKFPSYAVYNFIQEETGLGPGRMLAMKLDPGSTNLVMLFELNVDGLHVDANAYASDTPFSMVAQTPYLSFSGGGFEKLYGRVKPELGDVGSYSLAIEADDGLRVDNIPITTNGTGGIYTEDITLPYFLDGKNLSVKIEGADGNEWVRALHMQYARRVY